MRTSAIRVAQLTAGLRELRAWSRWPAADVTEAIHSLLWRLERRGCYFTGD